MDQMDLQASWLVRLIAVMLIRKSRSEKLAITNISYWHKFFIGLGIQNSNRWSREEKAQLNLLKCIFNQIF